jgi:hypothetical protein
MLGRSPTTQPRGSKSAPTRNCKGEAHAHLSVGGPQCIDEGCSSIIQEALVNNANQLKSS